MLAVGHAKVPESMFNNSQLFPAMFPWLYPYGKGGFQSHTQTIRMYAAKQCTARLQYWDKRFQEDEYFMYIAFNHKQIKSSSISSRLAAKRSSWQSVVDCISSADVQSLDSLIEHLKGDYRIQELSDASASR